MKQSSPFNFEKLDAWNKAFEFADLIYKATLGFPAAGRFGLTNQLRRAAVSVSPNIAEGSSRSSRIDFARFVGITTGSLLETVSQSIIAKNQSFLREHDGSAIYSSAPELSRMLSGLRTYLPSRE